MIPFDGVWEDPLQVFRAWFALAEQTEPNDPNAVALATVDAFGKPSLRMVLVKGVDERGLRFFTSRDSRKGVQLEGNPNAAMCFHWKSLRLQVRFEGTVEKTSRDEAQEYFYTRSRGSQIAAAASIQSRPLGSLQNLKVKVAKLTSELGDDPVPVPEDWNGYVLRPELIEFWQDGRDRLHQRMEFIYEGGSWRFNLLYP